MFCPVCGFEETKVVDSRIVEDGKGVRRRRECAECGYRFTTYERSIERSLVVTKRDGSSEPFDSEKVMRGLLTATAKRSVPFVRLKELVADIETDLRSGNRTEVKSSEVGDMVLERLRGIDDLAYIRFASVYKDFKSTDEFIDAIKELD